MVKTTARFFCAPLDTGIKWFGYIFAVLNLLSVLGYIAMLCFFEDLANEMKIGHDERQTLYIKCILGLASCTLGMVFTYMLVLAVKKRNRKYLLPWLIYVGISLSFFTIIMCPILLPVGLFLSVIGVVYYIYYCVYSLFAALRDEELMKLNSLKNVTDSYNIPPA